MGPGHEAPEQRCHLAVDQQHLDGGGLEVGQVRAGGGQRGRQLLVGQRARPIDQDHDLRVRRHPGQPGRRLDPVAQQHAIRSGADLGQPAAQQRGTPRRQRQLDAALVLPGHQRRGLALVRRNVRQIGDLEERVLVVLLVGQRHPVLGQPRRRRQQLAPPDRSARRKRQPAQPQPVAAPDDDPGRQRLGAQPGQAHPVQTARIVRGQHQRVFDRLAVGRRDREHLQQQVTGPAPGQQRRIFRVRPADAGQPLVLAGGRLRLHQLTGEPARPSVQHPQRPQPDRRRLLRQPQIEQRLVVAWTGVLDGAPDDQPGVSRLQPHLDVVLPLRHRAARAPHVVAPGPAHRRPQQDNDDRRSPHARTDNAIAAAVPG